MPDFDVCVIGSGAGGAPVAYAAAQKGLRVVVLEKGKRYAQEDFIHDEVRVSRRDMWVPYPADEPHMLAKNGAPAERSKEGWIANCVGGGTVHMSGFVHRLHPDLPPITLFEMITTSDEIGIIGAAVNAERVMSAS